MRKFGSDLVVDLLRAYEIPFVPMNPGASFRGLHDSLVNWGTGGPEMIICTNEKIAVNVAHGYAKMTGRPLAAIVHDVVGLMQGTMGVYTSYLDQVPVLVLGGTGPMAISQRRPHIEWIHTAFPQGDLVRNFVKWDDQPFDAQGVVDGFARGYQVATTEPCGPVYMCYDLGFQEQPLDDEPALVVHRRPPEKQFPAAEDALREIARALVRAKSPAIVAGRVGRDPGAAAALGEVARLAGVPVLDQGWRFNLPNVHPMHCAGKEAVDGADTVLALDVVDLYGALTSPTGGRGSPRRWLPAEDAHLVEMRLDLLSGNGWLPKFEKYQPVDATVMADTSLALPDLVRVLEEETRGAGASSSVRQRTELWSARHAQYRETARREARKVWDARPISTARLAGDLWDVVRDEDYVLTGSGLSGWVTKLWDLDDWSRYPGRSLGTATQIGTSMGVALACRGTGKFVVNVQPDGDLLFDPGTLWTIASSRLPMVMVMFNNRAYYNDWEHQQDVARDRGRDERRAHIGLDLDGPAPDYAAMARSFGWSAEGPIEEPEELRPALERAVKLVRDQGVPALVDVVCQHR
ncbi:MAG: thiamine pyrophosphate-binding protein [Actinomycetes bacterium]